MGKKGRMKISKVKRNNQTTNKMRKQGKSKLHRHHTKVQSQSQPVADYRIPDSDSDASDGDPYADMLDEEEQDDMLRRLSAQPALLATLPPAASQTSRRKRAHRHSDSGAESDNSDDAEARYRRELAERPAKRVRSLLPIKTRDGLQARDDSCEDTESEHELPELSQSTAEPDEETDSGVDGAVASSGSGDEAPPVSALQLVAVRRDRLRRERLRIGALCSSLLENPEKKLKNLSVVVRLMKERERDGTAQLASVRKLAALSAFEVFRDVLPEYSIRHQDYTDVKLKKDTLALYKHEKELLDVYRRYLQHLEHGTATLRSRAASSHSSAVESVALVCVRCLCGLLVARPHFNFSTNLVATIVPLLETRVAAARALVAECCSRVLADDTRGEISLSVVRCVARLARRREDRLRPEALRCLLALRAHDAFEDGAELRRRRLRDEKRKKRIINLSKNEKKRAKKLREVERELKETAARENATARQRHLAEATRLLFHGYFRVLKGTPGPALLAAALEGIAKFAHVINVDYYSDVVVALGALAARAEDARSRLQCVRAALAVLAGRGEALAVDPARFHDFLCSALAALHAGCDCDDIKMSVECVDAVCGRARKVPGAVLSALAKRCTTLATQLLHEGSLASLALVHRLALQGPAVRAMLHSETAPAPDDAPGLHRYDPLAESAAQCGARAAALHELTVLRRHYHPHVRATAAALAAPPHSLPPYLAKLSPVQLVKQYESSQMAFKPAVAAVAVGRSGAGASWAQNELRTYCEALETAAPGLVDFTALLQRR